MEFIVPAANTVMEMECLGGCDHAHMIMPAMPFVYRESYCGSNKKELVVFHEVSDYDH